MLLAVLLIIGLLVAARVCTRPFGQSPTTNQQPTR